MSLLDRIREFFSAPPARPAKPPTCAWCSTPFDNSRVLPNWWTVKYCSTECGHKYLDAEAKREKQLSDGMDNEHDYFEKL